MKLEIKDLVMTMNCSSRNSQTPSGLSEGTGYEEKRGEARSCIRDIGRKGM